MISAAHSFGRHGVRDAAIILVMFGHGLRTAELVALKWSQVDLAEGYIDIHRVKHGHDSIYPLRSPELRALRQIQRDYPETQYVFVSERKAPLSTRTLRHIVARAGEIAKLGETGNCNAELIAEFAIWNRQTKLGKVFDFNTCFKLLNGADRCQGHGSSRTPDVSWISLDRWERLTSEEREKFPPITPDFVLELLSPSNNLKTTQDKMIEYQENGVKLGWLIVRKLRQVEIYRQSQGKEILTEPKILSGEDILPEFVLDLSWVW